MIEVLPLLSTKAQAHGDYQSVGGGRSRYPDAQPLWRHLSHQQVLTTVDISATGLLLIIITIFLNVSRQRPVSISRGIPHQVRKEHYTSQIEKSK